MIPGRRFKLLHVAWMSWMILAAPATASPTTVALLDVGEGELTAEQQKSWQNWRDLLEVQLSRGDEWRVVERARLNQILQEMELRLYGRGAEERAILQGGMLGAELLIQPVVKQKGEAPEILLSIVSTRLAERVGEAALKWPLPPAETFWHDSLSKELLGARDVLDRTRKQPTVAVLFFENETKEGRFQYLGEKLERSLADALAKTGKFHVLRRQEVVTARPETVLVATGWTQPSALWQAQHADVALYGAYSTQGDSKLPVDELPFDVRCTVYSRRGGTVSVEQGQARSIQWKADLQALAGKIAAKVQERMPDGTAAAARSRHEAEKLLAEGREILRVRSKASDPKAVIREEFLEGAEGRALRCFLVVSFLAPDWEEPFREFIALWPIKHYPDEQQLAFAEEYFSRFGGMESAGGKKVCSLVMGNVTYKIHSQTWWFKSDPERREFLEKNRKLVEIARIAYLAEAQRHTEDPSLGDFDNVMAHLCMIQNATRIFDLFEQTKSCWMKPKDFLRCLDQYANAAKTPEQRGRVRVVLDEYLRRSFQAKVEHEPRDLDLVYSILLRTSTDYRTNETYIGVGTPAPRVPLKAGDEALLKALRAGQEPLSLEQVTAMNSKDVPQAPGIPVAGPKPLSVDREGKARYVSESEIGQFRHSLSQTIDRSDAEEVVRLMQKFGDTHPKQVAFQIFDATSGAWFTAAIRNDWFPVGRLLECLRIYAKSASMVKGDAPYCAYHTGADPRKAFREQMHWWLSDWYSKHKRAFTPEEVLQIRRCFEDAGEPAWGLLQSERIRLGKVPWRVFHQREFSEQIRGLEICHFPVLQLSMPRIPAKVEVIPFPETQPPTAGANPPLVNEVRVLGRMSSDVFFSWNADQQGQKTAHLLCCDKSGTEWRNLSSLCKAKHPPVKCALSKGGRIFAGTEGQGVWVLDPGTRQSRHLGLEDGLPSDHVNSVIELNGEVWLAGGKEQAALARLDPDSLKLFVPSFKRGGFYGAFMAGTSWLNRLWLGTLTSTLEYNPLTSNVKVFTKNPHSTHVFGRSEGFLLAGHGGGLYSFDRHQQMVSHGYVVGNAYGEEPVRFCGTCGALHLGGTVKGTYFDFFPDDQVEDLERRTGYLAKWRAGVRVATLVPTTRMPPIGCLAGDGDWAWIGSGERLFLYRPSTQTWHGGIDLPQGASSVAVSDRFIWLGGERLMRIDRREALQGAMPKGLPNQLQPVEVDEAIGRLADGEQGLLYLGLGKFEKAAECLERAVREDITEPEYFLGLFIIHSPWGLDRADKCRQYGDRLQELYPGTTWSRTVEDWRRFAESHPPKEPEAK